MIVLFLIDPFNIATNASNFAACVVTRVYLPRHARRLLGLQPTPYTRGLTMRQLSDIVYRDNIRVKHHKKRKLEEVLQEHDGVRRQLLPQAAESEPVQPMAQIIIEHMLEARHA